MTFSGLRYTGLLALAVACATGSQIDEDQGSRRGVIDGGGMDSGTSSGGTSGATNGGASVGTGASDGGGGTAMTSGGAAGTDGGAGSAGMGAAGTAGSGSAPDAGSGGTSSPDAGFGAGGGSGGASVDGGGAAGCASGEKRCGGLCVEPNPRIGCSLSDCDPCPAPPADSQAVCTGETCDFTCDPGFTKTSTDCTPDCTPITCADVGNQCGDIPDNCGDTISCGCTPPNTCGGGGVPGECGCPDCCPAGGSVEVCNGVDDDLDGLVDEPSGQNTSCGACTITEQNGFAYWFCESNAREWQQAEDFCVARGAHLASIADQAENDFIQTTFGGTGRVWVGMTDSASDGNWVWTDGSTPTFWNFNCDASARPSSSAEDCNTMIRESGCWDDDDCSMSLFGSSRDYPFVCKAPHESTCE